MCGIVTVFGDLDSNDLIKHRQLLEVGEIRGKSATGVAAVSKNGKQVTVVKRAIAGTDFTYFEAEKLKQVYTTSNKAIIGHNRAPTVGANSDKNAHPFQVEHVTGVHNGTIPDVSLRDLPNSKYYGTDSEQLYNNIAEYGVEDTFQHLWGAWAMVWFDKDENKLFALRNNQRPLFYCYDKSLRKLWMASEKKMLDWILTREDFSSKEIEIHQNKIYELPADQLFSWELGENKRVYACKPVEVKSGQTKPKKPQVLAGPWEPKKTTSGPTLYVPLSADEVIQQQKSKCSNYLAKANLCQGSDCKCQKQIGPVTPPTTGTKTTGKTQDSPVKPTVTQPPKDDECEGIPIFSLEELKELPESGVRDLFDRIDKTLDSLLWADNNTVSGLANENWSDFITWNKATKDKTAKMMEASDRRYHSMNRLYEYKEQVSRQIERREVIRSAHQAHLEKEKQEAEREMEAFKNVEYLNTKWLSEDGYTYKTLANKFKSEGALEKYLEKHFAGCANCGESNPFNFDIANSIELMDDMGFCCDSCKEKPRVVEDIIKLYGVAA